MRRWWRTFKALWLRADGVTTEQMFGFFFGKGANGKSTMLEVLRIILGNYAVKTRSETFMRHYHDSTPRAWRR